MNFRTINYQFWLFPLIIGLCALAFTARCAASGTCTFPPPGPYPNSNPGDGAPPYVSGTTSYNCTPGGGYDQQSTIQASVPEYGPSVVYGKVALTVTASIAATILKVTGVTVAVGFTLDETESYQQVSYFNAYYVNHYKCAGSGRNWLWQNKKRCTSSGVGEVFSPTAWYCAIQGWPANGAALSMSPYACQSEPN